MRKLAIVIALLPMLGACRSFGWEGAGAGITREQNARGIKDVHQLASAHETESYFRSIRRRSDGLSNAFGRDVQSIVDFWDRHFWNYDKNDPYVNYPSDTTRLEHVGRFMLQSASSLPVVEDITRR